MGKLVAGFLGALIAAVITALVTTATEELAPRLHVMAIAVMKGQPLTVNHQYTALISNDEGGVEPIVAEFTLTTNAAEVVGVGGVPEGRAAWRLRGFLNGGRMVLGYRSVDDQGIGYGTYFLRQTGHERGVYVGRVEGNSCSGANPCSETRLVRCHVILVRASPTSETVADFKRRYSAYLAPDGCQADPIVGPDDTSAL